MFDAGVGVPIERTLVLGAEVELDAPMESTLAFGGAAVEGGAGFDAVSAVSGAAGVFGCCAGAGAA